MKQQTEQVLAKIDKLLARCGTNKSKLLAATVYISDMAQKPAMHEAWMAWIDRKNLPTRACVAVELGSPTTLVEIVVTAAK
jgi:enamine deaminase RidA (YjgF/YER057c/UK114 family)